MCLMEFNRLSLILYEELLVAYLYLLNICFKVYLNNGIIFRHDLIAIV